jgi:hypothetical protein
MPLERNNMRCSVHLNEQVCETNCHFHHPGTDNNRQTNSKHLPDITSTPDVTVGENKHIYLVINFANIYRVIKRSLRT